MTLTLGSDLTPYRFCFLVMFDEVMDLVWSVMMAVCEPEHLWSSVDDYVVHDYVLGVTW